MLDLFSGIGGFSLGLERAGMETVAFCEQDKACQKVLKKHWPGVPIFEDVREVTGEQIKKEVGAIDLVCGGFPCQPWSTAGVKKGDKDDRDLWPEMFRVITEIQPRWVIAENVTGFAQKRMGLKRTIIDLESEGFEARAFNIPACAIGAPHERQRIWILAAHPCRSSRSPKPESEQQRAQKFIGSGKERMVAGDAMATAEHFREKWGGKPGVDRTVDGYSGRLDRIRQLGNAVVPQVVEIIGKAIMEAEREMA